MGNEEKEAVDEAIEQRKRGPGVFAKNTHIFVKILFILVVLATVGKTIRIFASLFHTEDGLLYAVWGGLRGRSTYSDLILFAISQPGQVV